MANLQSIMSSVANKKKDDDASPELDEEEQFRRQQAIIKMQYEKCVSLPLPHAQTHKDTQRLKHTHKTTQAY